MATRNPITKDLIATKPQSDQYDKGFSAIDWSVKLEVICSECGEVEHTKDCVNNK